MYLPNQKQNELELLEEQTKQGQEFEEATQKASTEKSNLEGNAKFPAIHSHGQLLAEWCDLR